MRLAMHCKIALVIFCKLFFHLHDFMPQFFMWLAVFVASGLGMLKVLRGFWATK